MNAHGYLRPITEYIQDLKPENEYLAEHNFGTKALQDL